MDDSMEQISISDQEKQGESSAVDFTPDFQDGMDNSTEEDPVIQQDIPLENNDQPIEVPNSADQHSGMTDVVARLESLEQQMATLTVLFKEKITRSDLERDTARRLSDEVQEYRQDLFAKFTHPILRQIVAEREDIASVVGRASDRGETAIALQIAESFGDSLDEILLDNDVRVVVPEIGEKPNPTHHRIVGKIPTGNKDLHKTIADFAGCTYMIGDKVIMPSKVRIYAFDASLAQSADTECRATADSTEMPPR